MSTPEKFTYSNAEAQSYVTANIDTYDAPRIKVGVWVNGGMMGTSDSADTTMSPDAARRLAKWLTTAADKVEEDQP